MQIKKITLGVRTSQKMFRVLSLFGVLADNVLRLRGTKDFDDLYYKDVSRALEQGIIQLRNDDQGNALHVDLDSIVFTKDFYQSEKKVHFDEVLNEFHAIWKKVNEVLLISDIRRIGLVVEHRFATPNDNPSVVLLKKLTTLPVGAHPAKFIIRFEERRASSTKGGMPDLKKDDFTNVICDYYDSLSDIDHPTEGHYNVNIDVQRYYSPLISGNVFAEVTQIKNQFIAEQKRIADELKKKGIQ